MKQTPHAHQLITVNDGGRNVTHITPSPREKTHKCQTVI